MLSEELLKKVRRIEITTRRVVDDVMSGQFRTHFKGQGVQFSEHRQYVPGDDVRHIDWKVSARTRDPLIKKFEEERELSVLLVVDVSGSTDFGSAARIKRDVVAELGGMLAYAAVRTGDKVGALLFAGEVEEIIPPAKGRKHVLRIVRRLLEHAPRTRGTALADALDAAGRAMKHGGIVFVVSDFLAEGYERALKRLARRHDVVAIRVADPRERSVPDVGRLLFFDPETGEERLVDTGSYGFRKWVEEFLKSDEARARHSLQGGRVESLQVSTQEDYGEALVRFFSARSRRRR
jgi:uncharacterized protein (DUF58 family)